MLSPLNCNNVSTNLTVLVPELARLWFMNEIEKTRGRAGVGAGGRTCRGLLAAVLCVAATCAVQAQSGAERTYSLADDNTLWDGAAIVEMEYAPAPPDWYPVREPELKATLAFPCNPERSQTEAGRPFAQYACSLGDRMFVATVQAHDLSSIDKQLKFLIAATSNIVKSLKQSGVEPAVVPVKKVIYGDARGRQVRIESAALEMETRILYRPGFAIMLGVRDEPGSLTESQDVFFNTLKLD